MAKKGSWFKKQKEKVTGWVKRQQWYIDRENALLERQLRQRFVDTGCNLKDEWRDYAITLYIRNRHYGDFEWIEKVTHMPDWFWYVLMGWSLKMHLGEKNRRILLQTLINECPTYRDRLPYYDRIFHFYRLEPRDIPHAD